MEDSLLLHRELLRVRALIWRETEELRRNHENQQMFLAEEKDVGRAVIRRLQYLSFIILNTAHNYGFQLLTILQICIT